MTYSHKEHQDMYNEWLPVALRSKKEGLGVEHCYKYFHDLIMDIACYEQVDADSSGPRSQFNNIISND